MSLNSFAIASLSLTTSPLLPFNETFVFLDVFVIFLKSFSNLYTFLEAPIQFLSFL